MHTIIRIAAFAVVTALAAACSTPAQPARPTCEDPAATIQEAVGCRLMQDSFDGRFSRRLTAQDVDALIQSFEALGALRRALRDGAIAADDAGRQADGFHARCLEFTGLSCDDVFYRSVSAP